MVVNLMQDFLLTTGQQEVFQKFLKEQKSFLNQQRATLMTEEQSADQYFEKSIMQFDNGSFNKKSLTKFEKDQR